MCGIAGFLDDRADRSTLERMTATLAHRGPDDEGVWFDADAGVGLGHRRLAVIDTSKAGAQPMHSPCGRWVLSFNGEIYNFRELRDELGGETFRGGSDTEVLLAAIRRWGVEGAVTRCNGMFAFAAWDRHTRTLYLARDRLGEKPLYWARAGHAVLFTSELKALRPHPRFRAELDRESVALYLRYGYVPAPRSIYRTARKLPPGTILEVRPGAPEGAPVPYWTPPRPGGPAEPLGDVLADAVRLRMVADVPLGALLSGGIDSTLVVALMQSQATDPVRTFTIGFREARFDEAPHASAVAKHLGTDHTELYVSASDALDVVDRLPEVYDEPFADSSQIPTVIVSRLARRHVTVALTGDGGDELFGGYDRYHVAAALWRRLRPVPLPLRLAASRAAAALGPRRLDRLVRAAGPLVASQLRGREPGHRLDAAPEILAARRLQDVYRQAVSIWKRPSDVVAGTDEPPCALTDPHQADGDALASLGALDLVTYLPDDLLVKIDRASMSVGLEARVPLLDHRAVEAAFALEPGERNGKKALKRILTRYVPDSLMERRKQGFGVPVGEWLRGPLRSWADDLLDPRALRDGADLEPAPVWDAWREHLDGGRDRSAELWCVLMLQAWLNR